MHKVLQDIGAIGVVPVIAISDADKAVPLAEALVAGGIPCAEITFRTAQGEEAIRRVARAMPDLLLGAGTVLSCDQVDRAVDAGAKFVVTPGFNPAVVDHCIARGIPVTPGCVTPSDMERAIERGLEVVKFFPAEPSGGLAFLKAVAGPFPGLRFMPTGGISAANIGEYLAFDKILACGGSWMVKPQLIDQGRFEEITALCREALQAALGFSLVHLGLNEDTAEAAIATAHSFARLMGLPVKEGSSSVFAGGAIEVMKGGGRGHNGHIAIGTRSLARAKAYWQRLGYTFDETSVKTDDAGRPTVLYLQEEIGGFGVHLLQQ